MIGFVDDAPELLTTLLVDSSKCPLKTLEGRSLRRRRRSSEAMEDIARGLPKGYDVDAG